MAEFRMPSLGADMTRGTLRSWLRKPGDQVKHRDIIAEVETEKGLVDVEVFATGVLEKILVEPGEIVPVGTVLAIIREEGEVPSPAPPSAPPPVREATPPGPVAPSAPAVETSRPAESGRIRISPLARKRAAELQVDLSRITGTGPHGAIGVEDVERAVAPGGPTRPPPKPAEPPTAETPSAAARMRQIIAAAMARSKREIPHYYLSTTVDLGPALTWLTGVNEKRPVADRLLPAALFVRAVALALQEIPEFNARWDGNGAPPLPDIHVGVAVALRGGGLVAPAIHNTNRQSLDELMSSMADLVRRARSSSLTASELFDGTITLTNLGDRGVETVLPVIYPPQTAIVGVGKVVQRPWVVDGQLQARPVVTISLAADHRVTDGHRGALFLNEVEKLLQRPEELP